MRTLFSFLLTFLLLLTSCAAPAPQLPNRVNLDKIVVLVEIDQDSQTSYPSCTGFFIGPETILTARHCVSDSTIIRYKTHSQVDSYKNVLGPSEANYAVVIKQSIKQDLALLRTIGLPAQPYLELSKYPPDVLDKVVLIGHGGMLLYTSTSGFLAAIRDHNGVMVYQVQLPVFYGFSGSPGLNSDGQVMVLGSNCPGKPEFKSLVSG